MTSHTMVLATTMSSKDQATMLGISNYPDEMYLLQLFTLASYAIMCVLCFALIAYLRFNRHAALKGDACAARKIVLPAFEPLIWILGLTTLLASVVVVVTLAHGTFKNGYTDTAYEGFHCVRSFVLITVVVYMVQKSVTLPGLVRSVAITFALTAYTLPVVMLMTTYESDVLSSRKIQHAFLTIAHACLLCVLMYVFIWPPGRTSRRALREYVVFVHGYFILLLTYKQLLYENKIEAYFYVAYTAKTWISLCPLFIWRVLVADTQHWRGMGQRAVALQSYFRQKHNISERISSQGLHVLIEMHRKFIIDFAYLELKSKIGVGSSAVVFNGLLHSKTPVAIKVYTPTEFDDDIVAGFSHEAALCGALHHPNVVKFYGMCVCPPTICLVSELCQGSLDSVTLAIARRQQHHHQVNRQQQIINVAYMLDAARAVAYIHSFSPPFVHRDIKPANFLVDADNTVKLTDFGESRSLPKQLLGGSVVVMGDSQFSNSGSVTSVRLPSGASLRRHKREENRSVGDAMPLLTVKGTVDYMAPEIIQGRAGVATYGETADVYSLGITMWDVLYPGKEKFPEAHNNHLHVFESVLDGTRPEIDDSVHPMLRELVERAWHADPRQRPSAQEVVYVLEKLQEELLAVFASKMSDELESDLLPTPVLAGRLPTNGSSSHSRSNALRIFSALLAIDRMEELRFVDTEAEAIRVGNALMDAGLLHHAKHERAFEAGEGLYFFDAANISLCRPAVMSMGELEEENDDDMNENDENEEERAGHVVALPTKRGRGLRRATTEEVIPKRRKPSTAVSATHSTTCSQTTTVNSLDQVLFDNGLCPCRELGRRTKHVKSGGGSTSKRRFRRMRHKGGVEENMLTARLLGADTVLSHVRGQESGFEDFADRDSYPMGCSLDSPV